MSTLDISDALAGGSAQPPHICKFGRLLEAVPLDQALELVARLNGDDWSDARLASLITGTAFGRISSETLRTHRIGECCCSTIGSQAA